MLSLIGHRAIYNLVSNIQVICFASVCLIMFVYGMLDFILFNKVIDFPKVQAFDSIVHLALYYWIRLTKYMSVTVVCNISVWQARFPALDWSQMSSNYVAALVLI